MYPLECDLEEYLNAAACERQQKNETLVLSEFPNIKTIHERVFYGMLSWTLPNRKERWIHSTALINRGNGYQTGSEVARDYLDWKFPKKLRACSAQAQSLRFPRSAPLYVRPSVLEFGSYVDITATYLSFMDIIGWNVDYFPGNWLVKGSPPSDFPLREVKVARNSLVSTGLPTPMRIWTGERFVDKHRRNTHLNLGLWSCIMDVLHAIAGFALRLGAVYVHTDGYILQAWDAQELIEYIAQFGLVASIKASGLSIVNGVGNYKVGERQTKHYGTPFVLTGGIDSVRKIDDARFISKFNMIVRERLRSSGHYYHHLR